MNSLKDAVALLDAEMHRLFQEGLDEEQRECLLDPGRYDEAIDMLDDMEARMGVTGFVRGEVADALMLREMMVEAMTAAASDWMEQGIEPTSAARTAANDGGIDFDTPEMAATVPSILQRMGCDA